MKTKRGAVGVARATGLVAAVVLAGGVTHAQFPHPLRLDELDGTTGVRFQGVPGSDGGGDGAARTAAGVGDVNGDGYEDFALGAVDGPTGMHLGRHIFVQSKGDYYDIAESEPQEESED